MAFNINEIKAQLQYGGARPSLFQVRFLNPATSDADLKVPFMVKAAAIPAAMQGDIPVPYFGRKIKVAATGRTYDNWTVTVINDEDFRVRKALEAWSHRINLPVRNLRDFGTSAPAEYKQRAEIVQYGQTGQVLRVYQFEGIFPVNVSPIEMNWENGDTIEEFTCEFALDYWTVPGELA
jgi:hypothetical protein